MNTPYGDTQDPELDTPLKVCLFRIAVELDLSDMTRDSYSYKSIVKLLAEARELAKTAAP